VHLLAITPIHVDDEELTRRQQRYDRLAPAAVTVHLEDLGKGSEVPRALETADDITASESALVKRFGCAHAEGFDGFLPDCVLDPVVDHESSLTRPVFGIARLTAHFLGGFGLAVGAVARNQAIAHELDRKLKSYGLRAARQTDVLDLSVEDIADQARWAAAVERTARSLPCDTVINACSAVDIVSHDAGPALVDPTWVALQMIGLRAATGPRR
jgi:Asp/Glu/hydantoin racemase